MIKKYGNYRKREPAISRQHLLLGINILNCSTRHSMCIGASRSVAIITFSKYFLAKSILYITVG